MQLPLLTGIVPSEVTPYVKIGVISELLVDTVPSLIVATIFPVPSRIEAFIAFVENSAGSLLCSALFYHAWE